MSATGRPPLNRYRADVVLVVEVGAIDGEDAYRRFEDLIGELEHRFASAIRNAGGRKGAPRLVQVTALDSSEV